MSIIEDTLAEFGRSLGLSDLRFRPNGSVVLSLQSIGTLGFDLAGRGQDAVVVSLSRPCSNGHPVDARMLLSRAHYRHGTDVPVHTGLAREHLVFAVVLPQEEFTVLTINEAIRALDERHRSSEGRA